MTSQAPIDVVTRFCAAWADGDLDVIVAFFTEDAVYHNIPLEPVSGRDGIRTTIESFVGGAESITFEVVNIVADGPTVLTERVDVFALAGGKVISLPVMGAFEVVDGKIAAWRDYFDMNQFMSQLTA